MAHSTGAIMPDLGGDKARIVRVRLESDESGLLTATSPDMPGLVVSDADMESLFQEIPAVIKALIAGGES